MSGRMNEGMMMSMTGMAISQKLQSRSMVCNNGILQEVNNLQKIRVLIHRPHGVEIHSL